MSVEPCSHLRETSRGVSFSGAGLSAPSGVATFRDKMEGHWAKHDPMQLASPQGFARDPQLVMDWYAMRRLQMGQSSPNDGHRSLAARSNWVHITQNTDDLLERAGATDVLHLHGHINRDRCHGRCGWSEAIDLTDPPPLRSCPACGEYKVRPDVVWFGEMLPDDVWSRAVAAIEQADTLIVVGTSALVQPAASLIGLANRRGAAIHIVNTEPGAADDLAHHLHVGSAHEVLPQLLSEGLGG
ncbi:MAG: NAD-dependent deacetylase [Phycisphaerales bacterium]|nr:NAD-dependent deacetylase [Phycisphaerales bacterium]